MAKTYINTVKYLIKIKFEIEGNVDKPDIVGAIFGQSEGLVGDELDLKELQKSGKVGRIEITHENVLGKTRGDILVPSSMDMAQTAVLAAAVESVDKVGPYEGKFEVLDIEDTRGKKREGIKTRAQEILERFMRDKAPDSKEITESVREGVREAELESYGEDKLPCGPEVMESKEIIVVEGRADVINLLKCNIKNAISMNGGKIPQSLIELTKTKNVTVFVDGDRGGGLIARKLSELGKVDYIAQAPAGKEVEELQRKEIIQSLHRKLEAAAFFSRAERNDDRSEPEMRPRSYSREPREYPRGGFQPRGRGAGGGFRSSGFDRRPSFRPRERMQHGGFDRRPRGGYIEREPFQPREEFKEARQPPIQQEDAMKFQPIMKGLEGTMKAKVFDASMNEVAEVSVRDLVKKLPEYSGAKSVVFDGVISKRLVDAAEKVGISEIIGIKKGKLDKSNVKTISFE